MTGFHSRAWSFCSRNARVISTAVLFLALTGSAAYGAAPAVPAVEPAKAVAAKTEAFTPFAPLVSDQFVTAERVSLFVVLGIAVAGLLYALMLVKQVKAADQGTKKMQEIAAAVREGANAYLAAQFRKIGPLILIITAILYFTTNATGEGAQWFKFGRAGAFLVGALFSWAVGFVGMRLATTGNLRVAAAATKSYGEAMQLGYRTGTITGMLTDGLGLLGGTLIFLIYGVNAYEALLGFGFGGTLLALFMRVGGGIYTKAADVGADLVGKIEKDIPEDDPRNAATIADNVGDNVGDCAGMAADIFESYEVTIVAAMILGAATFGHKGVMFPLLVRGIGVLGSILSTYTVKAGADDTSDTALKSVHRGFWIGSAISVIGFVVLGAFYLVFTPEYLIKNPMARAGFNFDAAGNIQQAWYMIAGADMRPALTCLIGVILAIALNKVTSYYTHTSHAPVKGLAKSCQTGHATNIIEGFAVGYESTVVTLLVIVAAIFLSVLCYWGLPGTFIAYGVAMTGIGMLTLTGNTISMDYLQQQRYESACRELALAANLNSQEAAIQQNLGMCWFQRNHFAKAAQVLEKAKRLDPQDLKTRYLLAYSLFMTGRLGEAEKDFEFVRARQPEDENTLFSLVRIYRAEKQDQQAIDTFQDLARFHPDSIFVHILMGESYDSQGKPEEAIAEYRAAIAIAPEMPRLHFDLGFLLWEENRPDEAVAELRKELGINPGFAPASYYLGEIALSRNDGAQAEQLLRRTLAGSPGCVDAHIALGKTLSRAARYQEALREYQRAFQLDPKGTDVHYLLAVTYRHLGDKIRSASEMEVFQSLENGRKPEQIEGSQARRISQTCMDKGE